MRDTIWVELYLLDCSNILVNPHRIYKTIILETGDIPEKLFS